MENGVYQEFPSIVMIRFWLLEPQVIYVLKMLSLPSINKHGEEKKSKITIFIFVLIMYLDDRNVTNLLLLLYD